MTSVRFEPFGTIGDQSILSCTLENQHGIRIRVLPLGAIIQSLEVPDARGRRDNVVLGFANLDAYLRPGPYFGAVAGRYANRIAGGRFEIDGQVFVCPLNDGPNLLHGGPVGFNSRLWEFDDDASSVDSRVTLRLISEDGDQGFPGQLEASVTYTLNDENCLSIDYEATTDRPTILNLTQHSYFNLAGEGSGSAMDHELWLYASRFTPVNETLIPTGELSPVEGTPFDFRTVKPVGRDIRSAHPQLLAAGGYDHNFVIDRSPDADGALADVARVIDPSSGRSLDVASTEPGVQFYSGNFLNGHDVGTSGNVYRQGDGFALETQHFPDSPNQPAFPSTLLRPGERFVSRTTWTFGWN